MPRDAATSSSRVSCLVAWCCELECQTEPSARIKQITLEAWATYPTSTACDRRCVSTGRHTASTVTGQSISSVALSMSAEDWRVPLCTPNAIIIINQSHSTWPSQTRSELGPVTTDGATTPMSDLLSGLGHSTPTRVCIRSVGRICPGERQHVLPSSGTAGCG